MIKRALAYYGMFKCQPFSHPTSLKYCLLIINKSMAEKWGKVETTATEVRILMRGYSAAFVLRAGCTFYVVGLFLINFSLTAMKIFGWFNFHSWNPLVLRDVITVHFIRNQLTAAKHDKCSWQGSNFPPFLYQQNRLNHLTIMFWNSFNLQGMKKKTQARIFHFMSFFNFWD